VLHAAAGSGDRGTDRGGISLQPAHKVGAADPSPAALAAGRCVAVRLAGTVRVPADEEE
jgi:hypothetical protein